MTASRRRWFSFSLRTLFVVVGVWCCVLGWLAYQLNWIRQRHTVLDTFNLIDGNGLRIECWKSVHMIGPFSSLARAAPLSLRVLGEPGVGIITIEAAPAIADGEESRVRELFPEARVNVRYQKPALSEDFPATQADRE